jgi:hypothetical protein
MNELPIVAAASVDVSVSVNGRFGRERHLLPEIAMSALLNVRGPPLGAGGAASVILRRSG